MLFGCVYSSLTSTCRLPQRNFDTGALLTLAETSSEVARGRLNSTTNLGVENLWQP